MKKGGAREDEVVASAFMDRSVGHPREGFAPQTPTPLGRSSAPEAQSVLYRPRLVFMAFYLWRAFSFSSLLA